MARNKRGEIASIVRICASRLFYTGSSNLVDQENR